MFKGEDIGLDVQELTESTENMNAKSLNYSLCKFVQEVANKSGGRYPSRTLYNIVCGLKLFLVEKNGEGAINPLVVPSKELTCYSQFPFFKSCCSFPQVWDISQSLGR